MPDGFEALVGSYGGAPIEGQPLAASDPLWRLVPGYDKWPRGGYKLTEIHFAWPDGRIETNTVKGGASETFGFDYDGGEAVRETLAGLHAPLGTSVRVSDAGRVSGPGGTWGTRYPSGKVFLQGRGYMAEGSVGPTGFTGSVSRLDLEETEVTEHGVTIGQAYLARRDPPAWVAIYTRSWSEGQDRARESLVVHPVA